MLKYNALNDLRNEAYDNDNIVKAVQLNKKCEDVYDKYMDACDCLPKREVTHLEKSEIY